MRAPVAVHLDIRPRLTFPAEPRLPTRRRWRLPPLAVPAVGYWLAMGALTYGFTKLGPHPLDDVQSPASQVAGVAPSPEAPREVAAPPAAEPPLAEAPPPSAPEPASEPTAPNEPDATTPLASNTTEPAPPDTRKAERKEPSEPVARQEEPRSKAAEPAPRISFPEFTDSSPAEKREHAADGPRIASLFEQAEERPTPAPKPDAPTPPTSEPDAPVAVSSCEAAIARNNEQLTIGGPRAAPDITREAYASILQNGRYLSACSIPERTVFEICAAVRDGRAVGITIVSNPPSPALNSCVRKAVGRLKFPQNSKLDVTHTRFDAVSR
ncbi:MAG: hypothetical protein ABUL60_22605 [Myxococcales bacterium]